MDEYMLQVWIICILILLICIRQNRKIAKMKYEIISEKKKSETAETKMKQYRSEIYSLKKDMMSKDLTISIMRQQLNNMNAFRNTYINRTNNGCASSDVIDAVKYAMIHSHPDNGGTQEDFIKYRKLYKNISGGNA